MLKAGLAVGAASALPFEAELATAQPSPTLERYVTTMPVPTVRAPDGKRQGADYHEIPMQQGSHEFHPTLGATQIWGYDGQFPGKTIEARRNERLNVKWINDLPPTHLLPVDDTIHGAAGNPGVRTVTHVHGLHAESASDGLPEAWFTKDYAETGDHFVKEVYEYENGQPGATLWYHDHALGITRLNVYAGLAGFYILRDDYERRLNLPSGDYEVPILLQDRTFTEEGELFYPDEEIAGVEPSIVPEFFGDTAVVNGKVWPRFEVEPRKYRFRVLNGCNSRFINPRLFEVDGDNVEVDGGAVPPVYQIGTDLGDEQDPTDDTLDPIESYYTGDPTPPEPNEHGNKDTVQVHPGTITRIKTRFGSHTGRYVWHCHILEHEDHEMMRPFEVVTGPK
ncbi:spore coat protein A [Haloplanus aerogenes]|nr:spore coat protein A [Haloplanus aerogenes]